MSQPITHVLLQAGQFITLRHSILRKTLSLGQYSEAFINAAIDGQFLFDINDEDLINPLGLEHRLHRKKILNCVRRLKIAEMNRVGRDSRDSPHLLRDQESGSIDPPVSQF